MTEAERVLAEVAALLAEAGLTVEYLPKPEPDRLTVAALDVVALTAPSRVTSAKINGVEISIVPAIRIIIAREVKAAEPSDEALTKAYWAAIGVRTVGEGIIRLRAALKGESA